MIDIPPLKKRKEDIPLLIQHVLEKYGHDTTKQVDRVTRDVIAVANVCTRQGTVLRRLINE
jgi:transcriptional regulator with PAS, ATPase and Fis domain